MKSSSDFNAKVFAGARWSDPSRSGFVWFNLLSLLRGGFPSFTAWWFPVMSRSNHKHDCKIREGAPKSIVPAGAPDWITPELIEATIRTWQPYYEATLTPEEAVIMILNVGGLFEALSSRSPP
jgi:hypothetical protein